MLQHLITFVHGLLCFSIVALVLLQRGKGADAGAGFGAGASGHRLRCARLGDLLLEADGGSRDAVLPDEHVARLVRDAAAVEAPKSIVDTVVTDPAPAPATGVDGDAVPALPEAPPAEQPLPGGE